MDIRYNWKGWLGSRPVFLQLLFALSLFLVATFAAGVLPEHWQTAGFLLGTSVVVAFGIGFAFAHLHHFSIYLRTVGAVAIGGGYVLLVAHLVTNRAPEFDRFAYQGVLLPDNKPMPDISVCYGEPHDPTNPPDDAFFIFLGGVIAWTTNDFDIDVVRFRDHALLSIGKEEDDVVTITKLELFDESWKLIGHIENDEFWVNSTVRKESPDEHTLVIFNESNEQVLKAEYINENAFVITGVFHFEGWPPLVIEREAVRLGGVARMADSCNMATEAILIF